MQFSLVPRIDLHEEIQQLYLHRFLFKLAESSVAIFLPLYLHDLGYGVGAILLFFALFLGSLSLAAVPAAVLAHRLGYKHTSAVAAPFIVLFYLLMRGLGVDVALLAVYALIAGVSYAIYWTGMDAELVRNAHDGKEGQETGFFYAMSSLAAIIGPAFGGVLIAAFGFELLFLIVVLLFGISFIPLLFSPEHHRGMDQPLDDIVSMENVPDVLTFIVRGITHGGKLVVWPLYLALVIGGSLSIGGAGALMALGNAVASAGVGLLLDEDNWGTLLEVGSALFAVSWVLMAFVATPLHAFMVAFANGLLVYMVRVPVFSQSITNARERDILEYGVMRQSGLGIGRLLIIAVLFAAFQAFPQATAFLVGFAVVAAAAVLTWVTGRRM